MKLIFACHPLRPSRKCQVWAKNIGRLSESFQQVFTVVRPAGEVCSEDQFPPPELLNLLRKIKRMLNLNPSLTNSFYVTLTGLEPWKLLNL